MGGLEFVRHLVERHYAGSLILVSGEDAHDGIAGRAFSREIRGTPGTSRLGIVNIVRELMRLAYMTAPVNVPRVIVNDPDDDHVPAAQGLMKGVF